MITHTPANLLFIRVCIFLLTYAPILEALLVVVIRRLSPPLPLLPAQLLQATVLGLLTLEVTFYLTLYRRHKKRLLTTAARHPNPPTRSEREALYERCIRSVPDWDKYLRLWFQGADSAEIKTENVKEWLWWAFWGRDVSADGRGSDGFKIGEGEDEDEDEDEEELQAYLGRIEALLGRPLAPGRGAARALRLTLDPIEVRYRSVIWYGVVAAVDLLTHFVLCCRAGFTHYAPHPRVSSFPPRVSLGSGRRRSPSREMGYYFREHRSSTRLPVVFIHGIGIGLWPYREFLAEVGSQDEGIGLLALELLPFSARLTSPPLSPRPFLEQVTAILAQHGEQWDRFVLVAHSYGSVAATHMLRSPELGHRVRGLVLIDPVSVLLHLPDVAYNFTRRAPRTANEWQLWYFASTEMGVAEGLGRHFFWTENIIWREELLQLAQERGRNETHSRKAAVCLAGRDLIVDTRTVAQYLASGKETVWFESSEASEGAHGACTSWLDPSGLEILWFPHLDHAQVFEEKQHRKRVVDVISRYCREQT